MYSKSTKVMNPSGLHARPASLFATEAMKYASEVSIRNVSKDGVFKNAKSVIMLLTMEAIAGTTVEISAEGSDEVEAVDNLVKLIDSGLGEG